MSPEGPSSRDTAPPTEPALRPLAAGGAGGAASAAFDEARPADRGDGGTVAIGAPPPQRIGSLQLLEPLGEGGMGEVWKARDLELDRLVAVKLLGREPSGSRFEERFRREARAAAAVAHPNVAHVYFAGDHEGRLYYAMELVRGRSLAALVREQGRLSVSRCVGWMREACQGLRAAQQAGVIHRDVKPSNLMVEEPLEGGDTGPLKLVDFGLARRVEVDATLTRDGVVMGTPRYMSPEQASGGEVDHRTDIYSLGASFYHLLCGEPPFAASTAVEVLRRHLTAPLPPLRSRNPAVPEAIAAIVERMLAKAPAGRFQSYDELLAALDGRAVVRAVSLEAGEAARTRARRTGGRWWRGWW